MYFGFLAGIHIALGDRDVGEEFPSGCNEFIVDASPHPPIVLGNGGEENRRESAPAIGVGAALHLDEDISQFLGKGRLGLLVETADGVM
jgi:hypothetical protein